jgi:ATP-dependent Clp protease ATP-binding subunit ClpC
MAAMGESPQREPEGDVMNRLSPQSRRVLVFAAEEARSLQSTAVCTQHLLLALLRDTQCGAARILDDVGLDYDEIRRRLQFIAGEPNSRSNQPVSADIELSPRLRAAFDSAGHEASKRGQQEVATVHLLIALLRTREGLAVAVLDTPGLGLEPVGSAIVHAFRTERALDA